MIKSINLENFRNFTKKKFEFSPGITVIIGPNASGKTNILEGLFLLATGKSFGAGLEEEMINYDSSITRLRSTSYDGQAGLGVIITRGENGWPRKKLLINGVSKRLIDFAGIFKVVLFGPWDMDLVTGSPTLRRRFLDGVLFQVDREYRRAALSYEKGLRQRNRVLWDLREHPSTSSGRERLLFWNQLLIKNGNYIFQKRREFILFINSLKKCDLKYDCSVISEERLGQYAQEEVAAAATLVGPHRDDFVFLQKERDLSRYGSRGQQRMEILWLKLAELAFIEAKTGDPPDSEAGKPTLLLDDIFSELDHEHRKVVFSVISNQQTIITTADEHFVKGLRNTNVIKL